MYMKMNVFFGGIQRNAVTRKIIVSTFPRTFLTEVVRDIFDHSYLRVVEEING